jgi:hypothetical protein
MLTVGLLVVAITFLTSGVLEVLKGDRFSLMTGDAVDLVEDFFMPPRSCDAPPTPTILTVGAFSFNLVLFAEEPFAFGIADAFKGEDFVVADEGSKRDGDDKRRTVDPFVIMSVLDCRSTAGGFNNNGVDNLKESNRLSVGEGTAAGAGWALDEGERSEVEILAAVV